MSHKTNKHPLLAPHFLHGTRIMLAGILLVAVFLARIEPSSLQAIRSTQDVLAYATNVNHAELLSATNAYRAQNGLAPLHLQGQLNSSSQAKAQHMVDGNYWAHVAPDGTQPWFFFTQAGYNYTAAGENLAYGFDNSSETINAWYNSPGHRANILGDYVDVGFGFVHGSGYQGGQFTVVVAHYGKTAATPPPAPAAPSQPTPTPPAPAAPTPAPAETPTAPAEEPATPATAPVTEAEETNEAASAGNESEAAPPTATTTTSGGNFSTAMTQGVSVLERIGTLQVPTMALFSLGMTVTATAGYALTHRSLVRHAIAGGERFVITHPTIDAAVVATAAALILSANAGHIG